MHQSNCGLNSGMAALTTSLLLASSVAQAVTIPSTVQLQPGVTQYITGVVQTAVTGADMAGVRVTAYFTDLDGRSFLDTAVWAATGGNRGGASGTLWSLTLSGDSYTERWALVNDNPDANLTRLVIDAWSGGAVFDVLQEPAPYDLGTPGSLDGLQLSDVDSPYADLSVAAYYRNQVDLNGRVYGDLYGELEIRFRTATADADSSLPRIVTPLTFRADTDLVSPIPEPTSLALMSLGLAFIAWRRSRGQAEPV